MDDLIKEPPPKVVGVHHRVPKFTPRKGSVDMG